MHNCIWNRWPFHILGAIDKHHHFHPASYMFASNEDTDSCIYFLETLRNLYTKLFGNQPNTRYTINDNSNAIFKAFKTVFSLAFQMNCFVHIISRNLAKYTCKLNDEGK